MNPCIICLFCFTFSSRVDFRYMFCAAVFENINVILIFSSLALVPVRVLTLLSPMFVCIKCLDAFLLRQPFFCVL